MFMKQGVGGRASAVKKAAGRGRDTKKAGGGFCRQGKKVSVETFVGGHDYSLGRR